MGRENMELRSPEQTHRGSPADSGSANAQRRGVRSDPECGAARRPERPGGRSGQEVGATRRPESTRHTRRRKGAVAGNETAESGGPQLKRALGPAPTPDRT